ncbi:MAG: NADP-dependent phosphogluconate dehydrogenase [Ardenticatenaceae bacterium]|nr:NADP-dependent phosphogluconate dehydrogenase [Ardenticatenaceae bacterium]
MNKQTYTIGMIGLGVMGRNLLLNIADQGFPAVGYDINPRQVEALRREAGDLPILAAASLQELVQSLAAPRAVILLVPAGKPVDDVIEDLLPYLEKGDLIIDGGNSHFVDTEQRSQLLADKGYHFMGMGISGGEKGARNGPSMMPGGPKAAYEQVQPILEAAAAHVEQDPCVTYLGPAGAGHYVKMVHNGIEYGIMQLIAESYDLLKCGLHLSDDELHEVYKKWDGGDLNSYLIEITADIFCQPDDKSSRRLIDVILDEALQKGTGMWTSQDAMNLRVPTPTIDTAVAMRNMSALQTERDKASQRLSGPTVRVNVNLDGLKPHLERALYAAMIITYAQGFAQLRRASQVYKYGLDLEAVARIWRGGCIIRAAVLEDIRDAFAAAPDLANLLLDPVIGQAVGDRLLDVRAVVETAVALGLPVPGLMSALAYYDSYRRDWLPANLIQAQRDYFGAHTYARIDEPGAFHTEWE